MGWLALSEQRQEWLPHKGHRGHRRHAPFKCRNRRQILESICLNREVSDDTRVTIKRKPSDFFVERLDLKKSRGDRTPLELFVEGLAGWDGLMRRRLDEGKDKAE
jgi:hypothetical protein